VADNIRSRTYDRLPAEIALACLTGRSGGQQWVASDGIEGGQTLCGIHFCPFCGADVGQLVKRSNSQGRQYDG
jgi:hypothetical protein